MSIAAMAQIPVVVTKVAGRDWRKDRVYGDRQTVTVCYERPVIVKVEEIEKGQCAPFYNVLLTDDKGHQFFGYRGVCREAKTVKIFVEHSRYQQEADWFGATSEEQIKEQVFWDEWCREEVKFSQISTIDPYGQACASYAHTYQGNARV